MSLKDKQWRRTSLPCFSQNINKQIVNKTDENFTDYSFLSRYHHAKWIILKDDIEFVTEFSCLLGHHKRPQFPIIVIKYFHIFYRLLGVGLGGLEYLEISEAESEVMMWGEADLGSILVK